MRIGTSGGRCCARPRDPLLVAGAPREIAEDEGAPGVRGIVPARLVDSRANLRGVWAVCWTASGAAVMLVASRDEDSSGVKNDGRFR